MKPAIDIHANMGLILISIQSWIYNKNEFQTHLYKPFQAVHDAYFRFSPDLVSKGLPFRRVIETVSVIKDGLEIIKVYTKVNKFHQFRKSNNKGTTREYHCVQQWEINFVCPDRGGWSRSIRFFWRTWPKLASDRTQMQFKIIWCLSWHSTPKLSPDNIRWHFCTVVLQDALDIFTPAQTQP